MYIKIDFKIFAFLVLFWLTNQIKIYVLFMIFAILHELGHLIAGIILKLEPKNVEINPFGLAITFEGIGRKFNQNSNINRILIAIAGPLINFFCMIIGIILPLDVLKDEIVYSNLILFCVNLIPVFPLDGGRILKSILNIKLDYFKSCEIVNRISNVLVILLTIISSFLIFYFENIAILLIILYLLLLNIQENKRYKIIKNTYSIINSQKII